MTSEAPSAPSGAPVPDLCHVWDGTAFRPQFVDPRAARPSVRKERDDLQMAPDVHARIDALFGLHGVYILADETGPLYVGMSKGQLHRRPLRSLRQRILPGVPVYLAVIPCEPELVLGLEGSAIAALSPPLNEARPGARCRCAFPHWQPLGWVTRCELGATYRPRAASVASRRQHGPDVAT